MSTEANKKDISRRKFLRFIGWGSFFATIGISIIASIRFLFPRVLFEKPTVFTVGFPDEFGANGVPGRNSVCQVYEKWKEDQSVWIIREQNRLYAVHSKCTHLGCTPKWFANEGVFKCRCHGSQFESNGKNFAGPAPRPLDRFHIYWGEDGRIFVDKGRIYVYKEFDKRGAYLEI